MTFPTGVKAPTNSTLLILWTKPKNNDLKSYLQPISLAILQLKTKKIPTVNFIKMCLQLDKYMKDLEWEFSMKIQSRPEKR